MNAGASDEPPLAATGPFQALRNNNGHLAAGHAMALLMGHPVFANRRFGGLARLIAGQVNRGHYYILFRDQKPAGFLGWAYTDEAPARAWLAGDGSRVGNGTSGDSAVFNIWVTDGPDMNSFALRTMRREFHDKRLIVARRLYADGRVKPLSITNTRL
ncbi:hypothetical protein M4578_22760 [Salipiger sp. P9]|nr:hypothetical protein [Salipiger pentaromativorans]